jgi:signal transduction histidine kinase
VARAVGSVLACTLGLASLAAASSLFAGSGTTAVAAHAVERLQVVLHHFVGAGAGVLARWAVFAVFALGALSALATAAAYLPPLATTRRKSSQLVRAARALSGGALPALAGALETRMGLAFSPGAAAPPLSRALAEVETAARYLEAWSASRPGEAQDLALALAEGARQVARLASAVDALSHANTKRVEELVGERTAALSSANRRLVDSGWRRRQLLDRTVTAAEGERARVAASLHDGPVQRLAALGLVLDRCYLRLQRDDCAGASELVKRARAGVGDEIHCLRQMMGELRPPVLDEGGLEAAIRDHLSAWSESSGVEVSLQVGERPPLGQNTETVAYRVVQEALTNIAKHARAGHVLVALERAGAGVLLTVRDDGKGFRQASQPDLLHAGHFGLVIMRERVELASGKFEVKSAPLAGTEVTVWLPAEARSAFLGAEPRLGPGRGNGPDDEAAAGYATPWGLPGGPVPAAAASGRGGAR